MKHIYLNLKRFDVPAAMGGVNRIAAIETWAKTVVEASEEKLSRYVGKGEFTMFFPELHIFKALEAAKGDGRLRIGCQGVYGTDVEAGENFGALTTHRPAAAMAAVGCKSVIIGHCEERNDKKGLLAETGTAHSEAVNRILNREVRAALSRDLDVLYCIGETQEEQERWQEVLGEQLDIGLSQTNPAKVTVAYEPVWSIGPGKVPADKEYIRKIARFIKERTNGLKVVYGGGLKKENAGMIASIEELDGGLIALTRFTGEIGFYPEEYLDIIDLYMQNVESVR